jgi:uncharacterized Zn-binding protein involved in type VI secretion
MPPPKIHKAEGEVMILGWLRVDDKAACGGTVIEGNLTNISMGKAIAFQGARIACRHNCTIREGFPFFTDNRRPVPHHLHKSTRGCPIYSTLNGIDGWEDGGDSAPAERYFQNADGHWVAVAEPEPHEEPFDEQTHLAEPSAPGVPYHIETMDGRTFSGRTGPDGRLPRIETIGEDAYTILWGDAALAKGTAE